MKRYVIQVKTIREGWCNMVGREYDTLDEARAAYEQLPIKADTRIAERYTVIRYKAVKI